MSENAVKEVLNSGEELTLESGKVILIKKLSFMKNMRDGLTIVETFSKQGIDLNDEVSILGGLATLMLSKSEVIFKLIKESSGLTEKDLIKLEDEDSLVGPKVIKAVFEENKDFLSQAMKILTGQ